MKKQILALIAALAVAFGVVGCAVRPPTPFYANCSAANAAGVKNLNPSTPGYGAHLDRDGDGVACEG